MSGIFNGRILLRFGIYPRRLFFNTWELNRPDLNVPVGRPAYEKEQVDKDSAAQHSSNPEDNEASAEKEKNFAAAAIN